MRCGELSEPETAKSLSMPSPRTASTPTHDRRRRGNSWRWHAYSILAVALLATRGAAAAAVNSTADRQLSGQICYTLYATDSYGDGWNGGTWTWADAAGSVVESGSVNYHTNTESLCADAVSPCYTFWVSAIHTVRRCHHQHARLLPTVRIEWWRHD